MLCEWSSLWLINSWIRRLLLCICFVVKSTWHNHSSNIWIQESFCLIISSFSSISLFLYIRIQEFQIQIHILIKYFLFIDRDSSKQISSSIWKIALIHIKHFVFMSSLLHICMFTIHKVLHHWSNLMICCKSLSNMKFN